LSAYYLKGVVPSWELLDIYKGMLPFMAIQMVCVLMLYFFPQVVLALPNYWYK
jgi:TRAP-type mannitol/chloroaromatic compound transport system permease large subunit